MNDKPNQNQERYKAADLSLQPRVQSVEHVQRLLQLGPLEFLLGAQPSASLLASRRGLDPEQAYVVDVLAASHAKYRSLNHGGGEHPVDALSCLVEDFEASALLHAEAYSLLGVYAADSDQLSSSMSHFREALRHYRAIDAATGACVCFVRHAQAMSLHAEHSAAAESLLCAEQLARQCADALYAHWVRLARCEGLYWRGQVACAAQAIIDDQLIDIELAPLAARVQALRFAVAVETEDAALAESLWSEIARNRETPVPAVAALARVEQLLQGGQLDGACGFTIDYLQGHSLLPIRLKRALMTSLLGERSIAQLPPQLGGFLQALLLSVETENQKAGSLDVRLNDGSRGCDNSVSPGRGSDAQ